MKLHSASIAAFRVSLVMSPHFVWIYKQNYNFSNLLSYIFSDFLNLYYNLSSVKSPWQQWHFCQGESKNLLTELEQKKCSTFPLWILSINFHINAILRTSYPHLQKLLGYIIHLKEGTTLLLSFWSFPRYWLFHSLHAYTLPCS